MVWNSYVDSVFVIFVDYLIWMISDKNQENKHQEKNAKTDPPGYLEMSNNWKHPQEEMKYMNFIYWMAWRQVKVWAKQKYSQII